MKRKQICNSWLSPKHVNAVFITCVFILFSGFRAISSTPVDTGALVAVGEHINLVTDRNMYAVGEPVYFKAFYTKTEDLQESGWSKVLYLELINPSGDVEVQQKLPLNDDGAFGSIHLSKQLLTGNYYLRAYTKWMTNFGPNAYSYAKIVVINPFDSKVYISALENQSETFVTERRSDQATSELLAVQTNKHRYQQREKVILSLKAGDDRLTGILYAITVVKTNTLDSAYMAGNIRAQGHCKPLPLASIKNLPEKRGLSLSGIMMYENGSKAETGKTVNLTILGEKPYFAQTYTSESGRFYFTIPEQTDAINLFLCPAEYEGSNVNFKVNNGFANHHYPINPETFKLSDAQLEQARELMVNAQVMSSYPKTGVLNNIDSSHSGEKTVFFYGTPEERLFLKDYIALPDLGEVFHELVQNVMLLNKDNTPSLKVVNENSWSSDMPLVLIDHVPVYDINTILSIPSDKIESIDVVNTNYIKGGILYRGIIAIYSKKNDIAGAELPKGGAFFSYSGFNENDRTVIRGQTQNQKFMADLRNTLYWHPGFNLNGRESSEIEFFTSDNRGKYTVLVRRLSKNGKELELSTCKFIVE